MVKSSGNVPISVRALAYAHLCPFCGWHRAATSPTMLDPSCEDCGGTLHAVDAAEVEQARIDDAWGEVPATPRGDGTSVLALLVVTPWLLPLIGLSVGDVAFAVPLVMTVFATLKLRRSAQEDAAAASVHRALATACAATAVACVLGIVTSIAGLPGDFALYVGGAASVGVLAAAVILARRSLARQRWPMYVDAGLCGMVFAAVGIWFLIVPGLRSGDPALTLVVMLDVAATVVVTLAAVALSARRRQPGAWWLTAACVLVTAGDGLASASAAGQMAALPWLTALLWAGAAFALATTGEVGYGPRPRRTTTSSHTVRFLGARVALPLAAILAFPSIGIALHLGGALTDAAIAFFGALTLLALLLAFARQAHLLVDHRRIFVRERAMRREATRRNEELEALTGLATTMTQTLEEAPIVEQALGVLHAAARATSAALHVDAESGPPRLLAAAGDWYAERPWVPVGRVTDSPVLAERGRRAILRLPLAARGDRIGVVTFIRPSSEPFDEGGVELLRLLVDQMGVAVQNARDYREKLEQAIRDPLTGLYNRRFLLEALDKEVSRSERYGSEASLALFDVDDFKLVNDTHGHAAGDAVLRAIAEVAEQCIRPSDSFARIGGEEFALLLPETGQLEALLVAERIRTAVARRKILADRRVTLSGGVASCPGDATTAEDLQRRADAALYWAKRNGKDLCAVASEAATDADADSGRDGLVAHLYALVAMIDAQQMHTRDHSENVAAYAVALGHAAGLERERVVALRRAAMLHDVGKIAVRSEILAKPARLTEAEFEEIRRHSVVGAIMLAHAGLTEEATWVRHHHERLDGRGYPDGACGDDLSIEARILFVADAFEAMTSDRPYRAGMDPADAVEELRACAGTQFDPHLVELFADLVTSGRLAVLALREG